MPQSLCRMVGCSTVVCSSGEKENEENLLSVISSFIVFLYNHSGRPYNNPIAGIWMTAVNLFCLKVKNLDTIEAFTHLSTRNILP